MFLNHCNLLGLGGKCGESLTGVQIGCRSSLGSLLFGARMPAGWLDWPTDNNAEELAETAPQLSGRRDVGYSGSA